MGPAWSWSFLLCWILAAAATAISADPVTVPQFSLPSLVWYSVPVSAVPAVPLLQIVSVPEETAASAQQESATARKVVPVSPAVVASTPVADNLLGVTVAKQRKPGCPYCDSSVFPYCSDKLLHDACCCLNPYEQGLPPQCQLADCSFLHANSCKEHRLITRCCCDRLLYIKR